MDRKVAYANNTRTTATPVEPVGQIYNVQEADAAVRQIQQLLRLPELHPHYEFSSSRMDGAEGFIYLYLKIMRQIDASHLERVLDSNRRSFNHDFRVLCVPGSSPLGSELVIQLYMKPIDYKSLKRRAWLLVVLVCVLLISLWGAYHIPIDTEPKQSGR